MGGRLRVDGSKQPLRIRDHALVYDGSIPHSSGVFNGDMWSFVLFTHSAWDQTPHALREQLIELGFPCPPDGPTSVAVPVVNEASPPQGGSPDGAAAADDLAEPAEVVRGYKPTKTFEEAQSREHQDASPRKTFCDVCSKAKMQRTQERKRVPRLVPDDGR